MTGRRWRTAGSALLCPGRTPLSPRAITNGNLANTPATPRAELAATRALPVANGFAA